ncbi:MAG TPA: hypothetical protein VJ436_14360 [Anaerolineales bacterium]|nr:hypothetical protein [Anaerolineales bacterium]
MTLPSVLVTDTNIWIDLEHGNVLEDVFQLPYQFITPDFARMELLSIECQRLESLGLNFVELRPKLVSKLYQVRDRYRALSVIDLAAFLLAKDLSATLVTGDRRLIELAKSNQLTVHGVIWLLDEVVSLDVLAPVKAAAALQRMIELGARLPQDEYRRRLSIWSG